MQAITVKIPKASKEVREQSIKQLAAAAETTRKNVRNLRKRVMDRIKKEEGVSADDTFRWLKEAQDATNAALDKVTAIHDAKKAELTAA